MPNREVQELLGTLSHLEDVHDADIFFYAGNLRQPHDFRVVSLCRKRSHKRNNVLLILYTFGGSANCAYRLARCFQYYYEKFIVFVPLYCKSAGTLLALGADELVMSDLGELGPLDIQYEKRDEFWGQTSGLDLNQGLESLHQQAISLFLGTIEELRIWSEDRIKFRTAIDVSTDLTTKLFQPIFGQVSPMRVGEIGRSLQVARSYGKRLADKSKNLKPGGLDRLIGAYPTHGFIIDLEEANTLFRTIRPASETEEQFFQEFGNWVEPPEHDPCCGFAADILQSLMETGEAEGDEDHGEPTDVQRDPEEGERGVEATVPPPERDVQKEQSSKVTRIQKAATRKK